MIKILENLRIYVITLLDELSSFNFEVLKYIEFYFPSLSWNASEEGWLDWRYSRGSVVVLAAVGVGVVYSKLQLNRSLLLLCIKRGARYNPK